MANTKASSKKRQQQLEQQLQQPYAATAIDGGVVGGEGMVSSDSQCQGQGGGYGQGQGGFSQGQGQGQGEGEEMLADTQGEYVDVGTLDDPKSPLDSNNNNSNNR